jgi:copper chaperone CopZ
VRVAVTKLEGVTDAEVSLNEGRVRVDFAHDNRVTLAQLRSTIRDQGFSPREATLTLSAPIEERSGAMVAVLPGSGTTLTLVPKGSVRGRLAAAAGTTATLTGRLGEDRDDVTPDRLTVTRVDMPTP